jgi:hypothetical protein
MATERKIAVAKKGGESDIVSFFWRSEMKKKYTQIQVNCHKKSAGATHHHKVVCLGAVKG